MKLAALVCVGVLFVADGASATAKITTEHSACAALKQRAAIVLDQKISGPASGWWCDVQTTKGSDFYMIGLHSGLPCKPPATACSSLIGWYAVRKSNGQVVQWNIEEDVPGDPL
jgi:hypothetical protein